MDDPTAIVQSDTHSRKLFFSDIYPTHFISFSSSVSRPSVGPTIRLQRPPHQLQQLTASTTHVAYISRAQPKVSRDLSSDRSTLHEPKVLCIKYQYPARQESEVVRSTTHALNPVRYDDFAE